MNKDKSVTESVGVEGELSEDELEPVNGGTVVKVVTQGTTVNRVKTSDKQQKAVTDFIKG